MAYTPNKRPGWGIRPTAAEILHGLAVAERIAAASRGPARVPQVYVRQLMAWLRAYQERVTEVQEEMLRWAPGEGPPGEEDPRPRWLAALRGVLDPDQVERAGRVPQLPGRRRWAGDRPPERDLNYHIDALAASIEDNEG